jgi:hypothetical protein
MNRIVILWIILGIIINSGIQFYSGVSAFDYGFTTVVALIGWALLLLIVKED